MTSLHDKVVFITGGARGIGAEIARRLRNKGARLVLTDLDRAELEALAAELGEDRVLTAVADVRDLPAMQAAAAKAVERFGGIDVVVANAGIASYGSVLNVDPEAFKRVLDVNLVGVFHTVRATLPSVIARRGYVLIVSSLAAYAAAPGLAPYNASKAGNEIFANALRLEVGDRGVGVGSAHMSWIDTALVRDRQGRPARLRRDDRAAAVAPQQDHHRRQVRGRARQGHRGPPAPGLLPGVGGPAPLAQAGAVHPGRRVSHPADRRRAVAPDGRRGRRARPVDVRVQRRVAARNGRHPAQLGAYLRRRRR